MKTTKSQCKKIVKAKITIQEKKKFFLKKLENIAVCMTKLMLVIKTKSERITPGKKVEEALGCEEGNNYHILFYFNKVASSKNRIIQVNVYNIRLLMIKCYTFLERAAQHFENLRKKYSRKKLNYQKASRSGVGEKETRSAKKDLDEYSFLFWLDDYSRRRKTKDNIQSDEPNIGDSGTVPF